MHVGFIGAGSWGTTLAISLAEEGHDVALWAHGAEQQQRLQAERVNALYLPDIPFPPSLSVISDVVDAARADVLVIATPTQFIRQTLEPIDPALLAGKTVVSASKGIEQGSLMRISELLEETMELPAERFVCLSGPSHAEEVARRIPTTLVAASPSTRSAELVQTLFTRDSLRVYTSTDLLGVELGGSLKNVIALCAGIVDGLGFGDNTKAALITRGLAEITRLGTSLGAGAQTFSGLSGLGDLVVTCTSRHSRNRFVGERIGQGHLLQDVIADMRMVAEGVTTTKSAYQLARQHGVEMPITNEVYRILFESKDARTATHELMTRQSKNEIWM